MQIALDHLGTQLESHKDTTYLNALWGKQYVIQPGNCCILAQHFSVHLSPWLWEQVNKLMHLKLRLLGHCGASPAVYSS